MAGLAVLDELLSHPLGEVARDGEADIYLVTWFPAFADAAEGLRRNKLFLEHMKSTEAQMQAESGKRATYRKQMGSMLFRQMKWNR